MEKGFEGGNFVRIARCLMQDFKMSDVLRSVM